MLIRAFRALPEDWIYSCWPGRRDIEAAEAVEELAKSPAKGRIRITGYLTDEELGEWYGRAGIFAFPSMDEGFGMPVLEAMDAGIPVIAGNRSALPEVCGDAAELIDPGNEDELAAALCQCAGNGRGAPGGTGGTGPPPCNEISLG